MRLTFLVALVCALALSLVGAAAGGDATDPLPRRVTFPSLDGRTILTGYLFAPPHPGPQPRPAIVLMHGRAGAYSTKANGVFEAATLSKRHAFWGRFWAEHGYDALLVDGFGPRGYPAGFPIHSYDDRPEALNEVTVRPLDAYGALAYLRTRAEVDPHRIALQGWSNGGSATMASMADVTLRAVHLSPHEGFVAAVAFYPACGLHGQFNRDYRPYAPLRVFSGDADEEVSATHCKRLLDQAHGDVAIKIYPGATHDFDDPGRRRRSVGANTAAADQAIAATLAFIQAQLGL